MIQLKKFLFLIIFLIVFTHPHDLEEFNKSPFYQRENFFFSRELNLGQHFDYALQNKKVEKDSYYLNIVIRPQSNLSDNQTPINIFHPVPATQNKLRADIWGPVLSFNNLPLTLIRIGTNYEKYKLSTFEFYLNNEKIEHNKINNFGKYEQYELSFIDNFYRESDTVEGNILILDDCESKEFHVIRFCQNQSRYQFDLINKYNYAYLNILHSPIIVYNMIQNTKLYTPTAIAALCYETEATKKLVVLNSKNETSKKFSHTLDRIAYSRSEETIYGIPDDFDKSKSCELYKKHSRDEEYFGKGSTTIVYNLSDFINLANTSPYTINLPMTPLITNEQDPKLTSTKKENFKKNIHIATPFWKRPIFIGTALSFSLFSTLCYLVYKANFFSSFSNHAIYEQ